MALNRIGIDYLTLLGPQPVHFIETVADAGASHASLFLTNAVNPFNAPDFSLISDAPLRRATRAAARDRGVSIALVDGFCIFPGASVEDLRPSLDAVADLGCTRVNALSFDPDWDKTVDQVAALAGIAADYAITVTIEPCPLFPIASVARALELTGRARMPNLKLLIDTMHVARSGETRALGAIDPMLIDYVQICDGPARFANDEAYQAAAMCERAVPGAGELPLIEMLRQIRPDVIVSGEIPQRSLKEAGVSDLDQTKAVVAGIARTLAAV